ncbi:MULTISPECIES: phosphodiesterase [Caldisericum]|jgi:putative phosphoesterase|uniref:Phosphoesterase n=1 Tax=Caldisericum exile TaxID=693075 RepID=A0A2J6WG21_9BACT|nr:MAG: phosphodiesterase [Caldisericum exile]
MKVGVVSDIHGDFLSLRAVFSEFEKLDVKLVLVLGDVLYHGPRNPMPEGYNPMGVSELINNAPFNFIFVKGNCDADVDQLVIKYPMLQEFALVHIEGTTLLLTHGDKIENFEEFMKKYKGIKALLTGHTHIPVVEENKFGLHINPGSISLPKDSSKKSFAILDIEKDKFLVEFKEIT